MKNIKKKRVMELTEYFPGGAFIKRVFITSNGWVIKVATPAYITVDKNILTAM